MDVTTPTGPTRRRVVQVMAAGAGLGAVSSFAPSVLPFDTMISPGGAATGSGRLVVVFLRGGMDGLSACVPYTEGDYYSSRPGIAIGQTSVVDLDGQFGLHPALTPLRDLYRDGRFAVVNAVGNPARNRSHFEAQAYWEQGSDGSISGGLGWLARHLISSASSRPAAFRAVGLGANSVRSLAGFPDALVVASLERFALGGVGGLASGFAPALHLLYEGTTPADAIGSNALDALTEIAGIVRSNPGGDGYNDTATAFADAATLLGAGLGVEVVTLDIGHWDTHDNMGDETGGEMADLLSGLAGHLVDFQTALDVGGHDDVTTVVMSEFGRRVAQNGSGGTDHGFGNVMFAMGGGLAAGVHGVWPGLAPAVLVEGDLDATTDFRDVLFELLRDRLGNADLAAVFPGHTHTPVGLTA